VKEEKDTKLYFKVTERMRCQYKYKLARKERSNEAIVLEFSSTGLIMVVKEYLKPKKALELVIPPPVGPLCLAGEVVSSKMEWYVDDNHKDMYFTTLISFKNISIKNRTYIIQYIYKCKEERRKARIKRLGL